MFGHHIREYIAAKGITQTYLAKKLNISNQALSYMLNSPKALRVDDYCQICIALDVPFDYFYNKTPSTA